jgi:hypothetical protein
LHPSANRCSVSFLDDEASRNQERRIRKLERKAVSAIMLTCTLLLAALLASSTYAATTCGPRIDDLLEVIYTSSTTEFNAFQSKSIDMVDSPLTGDLVTKWQTAPYNTYITEDPFKSPSMYEFDVNNNLTMMSYPTTPSPTYFVAFRQALAYMVNKVYIIKTALGGMGTQLEGPLMPWTAWYNPTVTVYPYNPAKACQVLYANGWRDTATPGDGSKVHYPATAPAGYPGIPGHTWSEVAGKTLVDVLTSGPTGGTGPGLIFYRRQDNVALSVMGQWMIYGIAGSVDWPYGLQGSTSANGIGIPCDDFNVPRAATSPRVMYQKNFHIYTGGWSLTVDPTYIYDLWNSNAMVPGYTSFASNYDNINDALWDADTAGVKFPKTIAAAQTAAWAAGTRFADEAFFIPVWANNGYYAHNSAWHVLNAEDAGIVSYCNLLAMNNPSVGGTGGQLRWGQASDIEQLNVIYSSSPWDWQVLDEIFDHLLAVNPLNVAVDMPWMGSAWTTGVWTNPNTGLQATMVAITLRSGINWVNPLTGTVYGTVTPLDVVFSFQYVFDHVGWNYPLVSDIYNDPTYTNRAGGHLWIKVNGNDIIFYFADPSVWALHWVGDLPIIPQAIFSGIADPHGFTPGSSTLNPATLTGSGPFWFNGYSAGVSTDLRANRNYFAPIVPNTDTDPTHIHTDWGLFVGNPTPGDWTVNQLDITTVGNAMGWTGPPGGIPADVNKDGSVNALDIIVVASNLGASWISSGPPPPHDVAVVDVTLSKTVVVRGLGASINVTVGDPGDFTETFNVTLYANTTAIGTQTVTLSSGNEATITFTWNTTGAVFGYYTMWAYATPVPGETITADNTLIDGSILIIPIIHDVAITDVRISSNFAYQGENVSVFVDAWNRGAFAESFNVTTYADENLTIVGDEVTIGTQSLSLQSGDSTTLTFAWNTTGVSPGNYTISGYATPVPQEADTTDNLYTDGQVEIFASVPCKDINITMPSTVTLNPSIFTFNYTLHARLVNIGNVTIKSTGFEGFLRVVGSRNGTIRLCVNQPDVDEYRFYVPQNGTVQVPLWLMFQPEGGEHAWGIYNGNFTLHLTICGTHRITLKIVGIGIDVCRNAAITVRNETVTFMWNLTGGSWVYLQATTNLPAGWSYSVDPPLGTLFETPHIVRVNITAPPDAKEGDMGSVTLRAYKNSTGTMIWQFVYFATTSKKPPTIEKIQPPTLTFNGDLLFNATVTDHSGIRSVQLYYSVNGGPWNNQTMQWNSGDTFNSTSYALAIHHVPDNAVLNYYIVATDWLRNQTQSDTRTITVRYDLAVTEVRTGKTVIGQGFPVQINTTVANQGTLPNTWLKVLVYANTTLIHTQPIPFLMNGSATTIAFNWNTTGWAKGNYIMTAYVVPILGETNTTNNIFGRTVKVAKKGDINADDSVDVLDLLFVAKALGTHPGDAKYNPNADINSDGEIDVLDLILVAKYLGT